MADTLNVRADDEEDAIMRQVQEFAFLAWGDSYVLAAGAGLVFFLGVVLVVTLRRLKRRREQIPSAVADLQVAAGDGADAEEVTDVRVLQTQIRTLEEALEQETARVREPAFNPDEIRDEAVAELHSRIRSTVRGLAVRMEDDPTALEVMARVEAAVERLVVPATSFVRPTLTISRQVAMLPTEAPPAALDPVRATPVEEPVPGEAISEVPSAEMPHPQAPYAAPVLVAPLVDEVVLPIPARTPSPEVRRGRRWRAS